MVPFMAAELKADRERLGFMEAQVTKHQPSGPTRKLEPGESLFNFEVYDRICQLRGRRQSRLKPPRSDLYIRRGAAG